MIRKNYLLWGTAEVRRFTTSPCSRDGSARLEDFGAVLFG